MGDRPSYIVVMKVGPFCGFGLDEIFRIKQAEEAACGKFFLGYGGVFCHPKRVLSFVRLAQSLGSEPALLFTTTNSHFKSAIGRVGQYSTDGVSWRPLPDPVLLVGSKFALVGSGLQMVNYSLNLGEYSATLGDRLRGPLDGYLRYRVDKACAVYTPNQNRPASEVPIAYRGRLVEPYCVFVR